VRSGVFSILRPTTVGTTVTAPEICLASRNCPGQDGDRGWPTDLTKEILMRATGTLALVVAIAASVMALHGAQAQPGIKRTDLQRHDLSAPGREVIQVLVEFAPGVSFPRHFHPGEEIVYVVEGSLEYAVEGKPPVTLEAGDVLFIPAGAVHAVRNVGTGDGAELATYIVEKGKPLATLVASK
jgi:quercetin dioxygenase-like cupin family protein